MRSRRCVAARRRVDREEVVRVAVQRGARQRARATPPARSSAAAGSPGRSHASIAHDSRIVAGEERGVDDDAAHDAAARRGGRCTSRAPRPELAAAARLPAVHPLAAIGVLALAPHRRRRLDQVLLRREELVVGGDDRAAEAFRREIDEIEKGVGVIGGCPPYARASRFLSHTRSPRTNVVRTVPDSERPAYGVTLWRCCRRAGSTTKLAVGIPDDEIRVEPCRDAPFPLAQPGERGRRRAHPARECSNSELSSAQRLKRPRACAVEPRDLCDRRERQLQRRDPAPRAREVARRLERGRRRRMIGDDQIERAARQPVPQRARDAPPRGSAART